MLKQMLAITVAVAAISFATPGTGGAAAICNPDCAPVPVSNSGGVDRGLNRANAVSPDNGADGRAIAQSKQSTGETGTVVDPVEDSIEDPVEEPSGDPCTGC
jgi:hypothetical protein